jgi:hypothetical protein
MEFQESALPHLGMQLAMQRGSTYQQNKTTPSQLRQRSSCIGGGRRHQATDTARPVSTPVVVTRGSVTGPSDSCHFLRTNPADMPSRKNPETRMVSGLPGNRRHDLVKKASGGGGTRTPMRFNPRRISSAVPYQLGLRLQIKYSRDGRI